VRSGKVVASLPTPGSTRDTQTAVAFSADGTSVVMACADGDIYMWTLSGQE